MSSRDDRLGAEPLLLLRLLLGRRHGLSGSDGRPSDALACLGSASATVAGAAATAGSLRGTSFDQKNPYPLHALPLSNASKPPLWLLGEYLEQRAPRLQPKSRKSSAKRR
ncbi:hypothetical protein J7J08_07985 [Stenotrophomonas sp. ISL-67]|uniref:hypothetical protein n=1 Tax=Stenotrophomonas sp. ISL-67 TaxID=2819171 RepID=UPI001BE95E5B|nr:hypothetical protein [Stenotrophomonas sp. ISL-67]MBT2767577.1 hypothetical protein [Stenotrophomonas sp. ISL-67]